MTMPDERMNSIDHARLFLVSLLNRKFTPGVPLYIRKEASARLRHYPHRFDVNGFRKDAGLPERVYPEEEKFFEGPECFGYDVKGLWTLREGQVKKRKTRGKK